MPGKPAHRFLVVLNFGEKPTEYTLPEGVKGRKLLLANVPGTAEAGTSTLHLGALDARIYTH